MTDREIAEIVDGVLSPYREREKASVPVRIAPPISAFVPLQSADGVRRRSEAVADRAAHDRRGAFASLGEAALPVSGGVPSEVEIEQIVARVVRDCGGISASLDEAALPVSGGAPSEAEIEQIVVRAVRDCGGISASLGEAGDFEGGGVFATMEEAVEAASCAQRQYLLCSMADRERFVQGVRAVFLEPETLERLSRLAVEETGMGNVAHKVIKNRLAAEKSPGTEVLITDALSGDKGLTLVEHSAFGVIGAITPATNPSETIVCNAIGMLAAGNAVVFSPHPRARKVSLLSVRLINRALAGLGAPANLATTVKTPSIESANALMTHPQVRMLVATGGPAIVKAVMSSGKKAIGAGAGNPPAVVDDTADIEKAARDIVNGCSFDNNLPCIAEKEVIAVASIADALIVAMQRSGAYAATNAETTRKLEALVLTEKGGPQTACVGKSAVWLLGRIGVMVEDDVKVILVETSKDHPFVQEELMMPILPLVRVGSVDEAIDLAVEVEHGNRHTAVMHSTNVRKLTKMARLIQTTIFVKNGPSYAGLGMGGEGYASFTIAGSTGEGLTSARSFARKRTCVMVEALNVR